MIFIFVKNNYKNKQLFESKIKSTHARRSFLCILVIYIDNIDIYISSCLGVAKSRNHASVYF